MNWPFTVEKIKKILKQFSLTNLRKRRFFSQAYLLTAGTLIFLVVFVSLNIFLAITMPIPAFGVLENRHVVDSTKIYDRTGKVLLYDTNGSMRQSVVPLSDISQYLIKAAVAVEDASFYEHRGVQPSAIVRASWANVTSASLSQGGSTITQQVVKNTLLSSDKSFIRKLKEGVIALRLEKHYTKDEILETYFNEIPYGGTLYGAEEASRAYFNKSAKDLTLSEAAYLAALTKAPTYLSPWGPNIESLDRQQKIALSKMLEQELISQTEYELALAEEVEFEKRSAETIKAPHFVFYVLDELEKTYGYETLYEEGLQVVTTLDWDLQQESEEILKLEGPKNERNFRATNAALVAIDPRSGQVLAMVGSRDYFNDKIDGQVNVALASRQPGSAFKPLAFATAFKKGFTSETVLFDLQTQFSTACGPYDFSNVYPCYSPSNHDEKFRGPISMRNALAQSVNVVAVKTLYLAGIDETIETARSLGVTTLTDRSRYGLSLALGGGEVTLLEMTGAYGGFANDGEWHKPTPVLSVQTARGRVLEAYAANPQRVLDKNVARVISDILSDNIARTPTFGANSPMHFPGIQVAVKTGTTNDFRDAWTIGYTPSIVVGAWSGNNDNTPMVRQTSSFILTPMWNKVMQKALARYSDSSLAFQPPEEVELDLPNSVLLSGGGDGLYSEAHDVLYWVDKDAPHAGVPENPYRDPQLALWEYPVLLWTAGQISSNLAALSVGGPEEGYVLPLPPEEERYMPPIPVEPAPF